MEFYLLIAIFALLAFVAILQLSISVRLKNPAGMSANDKTIHEELATRSAELRDDLNRLGISLRAEVHDIGNRAHEQLERSRELLAGRFSELSKADREQREELRSVIKELKEDNGRQITQQTEAINRQQELLDNSARALRDMVSQQLERMHLRLDEKFREMIDTDREQRNETKQVLEKVARDTSERLKEQTDALGRQRETHEQASQKQLRQLDEHFTRLLDRQQGQSESIRNYLDQQTKSNREESSKLQESVENRLKEIQQNNESKLSEMRGVVEEKLQQTLESRLTESFKLVSQNLEQVQRGLGEMQNLAAGVGNLTRVLTNVKERGTWGEYQLAAILQEILTPEQFVKDYSPSGGSQRVEYAVRLPGPKGSTDDPVFLPIDSKFPKEAYERLVQATVNGDKTQEGQAKKQLFSALEQCAKDISEKYICPPATTNFAIMFLPTESLYCEALRDPEVHDKIQRKYRVVLAGPTTLSALLNSLRIGFATLKIERHSAEIWQTLGAVRAEFQKFGGVLDKVQSHMAKAQKTIGAARVRTRAMERTLKKVEHQSTEIFEVDEEIRPQGMGPNNTDDCSEDELNDDDGESKSV